MRKIGVNMEKIGRLVVCFLLMYGVQAFPGFKSTPLDLVVLPDTLNQLYPGDSAEFHAQIKDRNGVVLHEYDSLIQWRLSDSSHGAGLRLTSGPDNMYYAGNFAYRVNFIIVRFSNPPYFSAVLLDTVKVLIKANTAYKVWVEPDTDINVHEINARLYTPLPVDSLVLDGPGDQKTLAAVKRDQFGNFVGFPSNVIWRVVGDTGVIRITTTAKPYLCMLDGLQYGNTLIRLSDTSGSILDTVPVRVSPGYITKINFVNVVTHEDITSININSTEEITIMVKGVLSTDPDTNHFVDITGSWSLANNVFMSSYPLPTMSASQWCFSPSKPGGPSMLTVTTGAGATLRSVSIPLTVYTCAPSSPATGCAGVERPSIARPLEKVKTVNEYYNLRGQKLRGFGKAHVDGIVFERTIGPNGTASVKKRFRAPDSKAQMP
jgi:hypothetical protein